MLGTYASLLILLGAAVLVGQAIFVACGRREFQWLSPAVGLAALCALAWWTVRLPGEGIAAITAIAVAALLAAGYLWGRVARGPRPVARDLPLVFAAIALASLPFVVEGRFGILGTGLNPDLSQHLFAVDRLADGLSERLISGGYPLGPHSLVVAVAKLGPSSVQAFDGLMLATAVAACAAPLALFDSLAGWRRFAGALVAGLAYLVASYLVQGAFKETMQALFVAAFAICLLQLSSRSRRAGDAGGPWRAVPLAVLAIGSVYVYSFPGLLWLLGGAAAWALIELAGSARRGDGALASAVRSVAPLVTAGLAVLALGVLPELGRMIDFASFETFAPDGGGLGNLFNRLSPLEALGIWPSGDFRVEPGDGAAPAVLFYAGAAAGLAALGYGLAWWWRRGERAVPAALAAATALWLYALLAGTPYQEAKALLLLAPLVALVAVRALVAGAPALLAAGFLAAAGGSSLLALANGPVGPSGYSPELAELRPRLGEASVVVYAPPQLLDEQHGRDYLVWELRGNRICVEPSAGADSQTSAAATAVTVAIEDGAVVPESVQRNTSRAGTGPSCPLIADGVRADPGAAGG